MSRGTDIKHSIVVSDFDYRQIESIKDDYLFVCEREISFDLPEDATGQAAEAMENKLSAIRAKHHAEQQKIIDSIAKLRQLAAPVEGELVDDRGLVERSTSINADEADDADFNDLPF